MGAVWSGALEQTRGNTMDRRTFLVGLLGGLAVTPTLIAATLIELWWQDEARVGQ